MRPRFFDVRPQGPRHTALGVTEVSCTDEEKNENTDPFQKSGSIGRTTGPELCRIRLNGRIQQISCCTTNARSIVSDTKKVSHSLPEFLGVFQEEEKSYEGSLPFWIMTRTATTCSVIDLSFRHTGEHQDSFAPSFEEVCTVDFNEAKSAPSWCTLFRHGTGPGIPFFAIASSTKERSSIFRAELDTTGNIFNAQQSHFNSIAYLRQLEFTLHPMQIWAVATRRNEFGEAMFLCDLRKPSTVTSHGCATRFWSPSHASYMMDGLCAIQSMWQHPSRGQTLFVSTTSNKVHELDTRMPNGEVRSWELPDQLGNVKAKNNPSIILRCDVVKNHKGVGTTVCSEVAPFSETIRKLQSPSRDESSFDITPMGYC